MKKIVLLAFVLVLLSTVVVIGFVRPAVAQGTIYIRPDGSVEGTDKIQRDGNIYTVTDNIYDEIVVMRSNIIIDGDGYTLQYYYAYYGDNGFSLSDVRNVTIKNTDIRGFYRGIYLSSASNINIYGNNITSNEIGISLLWDSSGNKIYKNNITNNGIGISLYDSSNDNYIAENNVTENEECGVYLGFSSKNSMVGNNIAYSECGVKLYACYTSSNIISENKITNNDDGICLEASSGNLIYGNNITNNEHWAGIYLDGSSNNTIFGNNIIHNWFGVKLWFESDFNTIFGNNITDHYKGVYLINSSSNKFHHNNFIYSTKHVEIGFSTTNFWDDGYPFGGNYWSDYTGVDDDGDGIGDTPYVIDENNKDRYPLMAPYLVSDDITPPTISVLSPENKTYPVNAVPLIFTLTESTSWLGYNLDGQMKAIAGNTTLSGLSDGLHSLIVYAKDTAGNTGASQIIYFTIETKKEEPFPTWIVAAIVIIAIVGAALLVYFTKIKKTTEKVK